MTRVLSSVADLRTFVARSGAESSDRVLGYGKSFASFGEIVQGRLTNGQDFLCTLPVDLWSTCHLTCTPIDGPLVVECELPKSRDMVLFTLERLGIARGFHVAIEFTRNIPIGKGLSSSTADMLAAIRATQEVFGFLLTETFVSSVMALIEPHDALHYNSSVAYNHRTGVLLEDFGYIPQCWVVIADHGGEVNTIHYNADLSFTAARMRQYDILLERLSEAMSVGDDHEIARCASASAALHAEATESDFLRHALEIESDIGAMGTIATHSGTCAGFLFAADLETDEVEAVAEDVGARLGHHVFFTRSLTLLS
jgi:L-threonine kinase